MKKLEALGLARKQPNAKYRRISEVTLSEAGQEMITRIAQARTRLMNEVLAGWTQDDVLALFRLCRQLAAETAARRGTGRRTSLHGFGGGLQTLRKGFQFGEHSLRVIHVTLDDFDNG